MAHSSIAPLITLQTTSLTRAPTGSMLSLFLGSFRLHLGQGTSRLFQEISSLRYLFCVARSDGFEQLLCQGKVPAVFDVVARNVKGGLGILSYRFI